MNKDQIEAVKNINYRLLAVQALVQYLLKDTDRGQILKMFQQSGTLKPEILRELTTVLTFDQTPAPVVSLFPDKTD